MTLHLTLFQNDLYQDLIEKEVASLKQQLNLEKRICYQISLVLDEICTNIFQNNSNSDELRIDITLCAKNGKLTIIVEDNGIPFDPTAVVEPNTKLPLNKREEGGLGLFLVKKFTSTFSYTRVNGQNQTTIRKDLENHTQQPSTGNSQ